MHALEWIEKHGRYRRTISAQELRDNLGREKNRCTWCNQECPGRRYRWCSEACVDEFRKRTNSGYIRQILGGRDKGVCALCGLDTAHLRKRIRKMWKRGRTRGRDRQRLKRWLKKKGFHGYTSSFWHADHITPVHRGGGLTGPENYRTLCVPCHEEITSEQNSS